MLKEDDLREPIKVRDFTPEILIKCGMKNLPMYENPSHIKRNILTKKEARLLGLNIGPRINYHGLGIEGYMKVIDGLDDPRAVFKCLVRDDYLVITTQKDKYGNTIVVPIELNSISNCNKVNIKINRIKTIFGFDQKYNNIALHQFISRAVNTKYYIKIYTKKKNMV